MYKVDDIILCTRNCFMNGDPNRQALTFGRYYKVIQLREEKFAIIDDEGDKHYFYLNYKYFDDPKLLRKFKLEKLNTLIKK